MIPGAVILPRVLNVAVEVQADERARSVLDGRGQESLARPVANQDGGALDALAGSQVDAAVGREVAVHHAEMGRQHPPGTHAVLVVHAHAQVARARE